MKAVVNKTFYEFTQNEVINILLDAKTSNSNISITLNNRDKEINIDLSNSYFIIKGDKGYYQVEIKDETTDMQQALMCIEDIVEITVQYCQMS